MSRPESNPSDPLCPACEYNLRGQAGDVRTCPECGARVDVPRLLSQPKTQWHRLPEFNRLSAIIVCLFLMPITGMIGWVTLEVPWLGLLLLGLTATLAITACLILRNTARRIGWPRTTGNLLILAGALVAYFIGVGLILSSLVPLCQWDVKWTSIGAAMVLTGFIALISGNLLQRWVGRRLVRLMHRSDAILPPKS